MTNSAIKPIITTIATGNISEAVGVSSYTLYLKKLSELLFNVIVLTKDSTKLNREDGLNMAIDMIEAVRNAGTKVMIIGNGGSAAIASHQAIDLWNAAGIPATTFSDNAQLTCLSNDYGYENVFSKAIQTFAQANDLLIAISSSGKSASILNGVKAAETKKCRTITLSGFSKEAPLLSMGDLNFYIDANEYGLVEVAHSALIHYFTDTICAKRGKNI